MKTKSDLNKVTIRLATATDAKDISLLAQVTFDETFGHLFRQREDLLNYFETTFSIKKIRKSIQKPNSIYWLVFYEDLPIGYAKLKLNSANNFIKEGNSCQLQKIYILKEFINLKIGNLLQKRVLKAAKSNNFSNIWLSVLKENNRAIHFYQKYNFEIIGSHEFQIGIENFHFFVMVKNL